MLVRVPFYLRGREGPRSFFYVATRETVHKHCLQFAINHVGKGLLVGAHRYLFHLAPLRIQITALNKRIRSSHRCAGLPGTPANWLDRLVPRAIGAGYTSGYAWVVNLDRAVSSVSSFVYSVAVHRQRSIRTSSGRLLILPDGRIIRYSYPLQFE